MTGEELYTRAEFRRVFELRAADIINPDVCNCGGILELRAIAQMAEPSFVTVSPHNYNSTTVGLAATLQISAAIPNFLITEYFVNFEARGREIARPAFVVQDGYIAVPQQPRARASSSTKRRSRARRAARCARALPGPATRAPRGGSMAISTHVRSGRPRETTIPVIDFGPCFAGVPGALEATAAELRDTLETHRVLRDGQPRGAAVAHRADVRGGAALPRSADGLGSSRCRMNEHNNGYMTLGRYAVWTSDVNANDKPDLNEAFFTKRERAGDDPLLPIGASLRRPEPVAGRPAGIPRQRARVHERHGRAQRARAAAWSRWRSTSRRTLRRGVRGEPVLVPPHALSAGGGASRTSSGSRRTPTRTSSRSSRRRDVPGLQVRMPSGDVARRARTCRAPTR